MKCPLLPVPFVHRITPASLPDKAQRVPGKASSFAWLGFDGSYRGPGLKGDPSHVGLKSLTLGTHASVSLNKPRTIPQAEKHWEYKGVLASPHLP